MYDVYFHNLEIISPYSVKRETVCSHFYISDKESSFEKEKEKRQSAYLS